MTASVAISFVLEGAWLALTPSERWSAARTFKDDPSSGRWLIIVCIAVLVVLVVNHSDSVRFVNRRRFLRVSVRLRAFVARFPFMSPIDGPDLPEASSERCGPPRFVAAVVTEIAGPGLRIESALEVESGERILVVFSLDEESSEITKLLEVMESTIGDWGLEKDATSKQVRGIFSTYLGRHLGESGGFGMWKDIYKSLHNTPMSFIGDTNKMVESDG